MAKLPPQVTRIAGVEDLSSLLTFLSDPKKYKEKLDELTKKQQIIKDLIATYTTAKDIGKALGAANSAKEEALSELAKARSDVEKTGNDARRRADEIVKKAAQRAQDVEDDLGNRERESAERLQEAKVMVDEAVRESAKAQSMLSKAERMLEQAIRIKDEFTERAARLQAAIGG